MELEDEIVEYNIWCGEHPGKRPEDLGFHIEYISNNAGGKSKCCVKLAQAGHMRRKRTLKEAIKLKEEFDNGEMALGDGAMDRQFAGLSSSAVLANDDGNSMLVDLLGDSGASSSGFGALALPAGTRSRIPFWTKGWWASLARRLFFPCPGLVFLRHVCHVPACLPPHGRLVGRRG